MIFVAGNCSRCGRYYELPRQEREASAHLTVSKAGALALQILCVNGQLCGERATT